MKWAGENLRKIAKEKNLSIVKLAEMTEVSRQTITDWIKGQIPKGCHLINLCKILNVSPDYFFTIEPPEAISIPLHRSRKNAVVTPVMQEAAFEVARQYENFFENVPCQDIFPVIRISKHDDNTAFKIANSIREKLGADISIPLDYQNTFHLLNSFGIILIFRFFPDSIKTYAFFTKIYKHRIIFVNNSTNLLDLIFPLLHEFVHAIIENSISHITFDNSEEIFCDKVANHIQFPDNYVNFINSAIDGLVPAIQVKKLKRFAKDNKHSLFGLAKRLKMINPTFEIAVGGADTNLKKEYPATLGDILFRSDNVKDFIKIASTLSPRFYEIIINQLDNITYRKLAELLGFDNTFDGKAVMRELYKLKSEVIV
jgi:transcriptional regulator with XRE-family HTH domain/Zn-dependent peptidase ImmA (M78 family)